MIDSRGNPPTKSSIAETPVGRNPPTLVRSERVSRPRSDSMLSIKLLSVCSGALPLLISSLVMFLLYQETLCRGRGQVRHRDNPRDIVSPTLILFRLGCGSPRTARLKLHNHGVAVGAGGEKFGAIFLGKGVVVESLPVVALRTPAYNPVGVIFVGWFHVLILPLRLGRMNSDRC